MRLRLFGVFSVVEKCVEGATKNFAFALFTMLITMSIATPANAEAYTPSPTLEEIVAQVTSKPRDFNFTSATDVYTVTENLSSVTSGTLNINGVYDAETDTRSTIDFAGNYGVRTSTSSTINFSNVELKNAKATIRGSLYFALYTRSSASFDNVKVVGNYSSNDAGGAIYNSGVLLIKNSSFIGNYIVSTSATAPVGGAIWTNKNLTITADNGITLFSGNYVQQGETGTKLYEAIYVGNYTSTLTLKAINGGVIQFDDYIGGYSYVNNGTTYAYDVKITGDNTGTLKMYNDIKNADVTISNVTFNTADGVVRDYSFNSLTSNSDAKYVIDLDVVNNSADKFIITSELGESSGVVTIEDINVLGDLANFTTPIQILKVTGSDVQLALSDTLAQELSLYTTVAEFTEYEDDIVLPTVQWDDIFYKRAITAISNLKLGLATTDTVNDSIGYCVAERGEVLSNTIVNSLGDTLRLLSQLETPENRNFNFETADDVYTSPENLGSATAGTLNINGVYNEETDTRSTIDFAGFSGFDLANATTLNLSNLEIKNSYRGNYAGALYITNKDAVVSIDNVLFRGNYSNSTTTSSFGGAIYVGQYVTLGDITNSSFINNSATSESAYGDGYGGAIYVANYATVGDITADFIGNDGTTIYNEGTIGDINGNFTGNYDGVIYVDYAGVIGDINGNFTGNYDGVIYDVGAIGNISGNFTGNYGVVIHVGSAGVIGDINANFIGNYSGAIFASALKNVTGEFKNNAGAAINTLYALDINGVFESNMRAVVLKGISVNVWTGTVNSVSGTFKGNYAINDTYYEQLGNSSSCWGGGAIFLSSPMSIGSISGLFEGNYSLMESIDPASGGAIAVKDYSRVTTINADFVGNYSTSTEGVSYGGAIYNEGTIATITETDMDRVKDFETQGLKLLDDLKTTGFIRNEADYGAAIYNVGKINAVNANFIENKATAGALFNHGSIGTIKGDFVFNEGGAIVNDAKEQTASSVSQYGSGLPEVERIISEISGSRFVANYTTTSGGAISNNGVIELISDTEFVGNYATDKGGAIYNEGSITIKNSSFTDNYAGNYGGAIYSTNDINIIVDNATSKFSGNYTLTPSSSKYYNAIYMDDNDAAIIINIKNNGVLQFDDSIDGEQGYHVGIDGDGTGTFKMYNDIKYGNVVASNVKFDTADGKVLDYNFNTFGSDDSVKYSIDIDSSTGSADNFSVEYDAVPHYADETTGVVTLHSINVIGDTFNEEHTYQILKVLSDNLQLALSEELSSELEECDIHKNYINVYQDTVTADTKWNDIFEYVEEYIATTGKVGLATTNTTNDSISVVVTGRTSKETRKQLDALKLVNQSTIDGRNFIFDAADNVYKVTENLGATGAGVFNIDGVATLPTRSVDSNGASRSTIDADGHSMFVIDDDSTMNLTNVEIKNAVDTYVLTDPGEVNDTMFVYKGSVVTNNTGTLNVVNTVFANNTTNFNVDLTVNNEFNSVFFGGAVVNRTTVTNLGADFINNKTVLSITDSGTESWSTISILGGALSNVDGATIETITGLYENNIISFEHSISEDFSGYLDVYLSGAAIGNDGMIENLSATFKNNGINFFNVYGVGLNNEYGYIKNLSSNFIGNYITNIGFDFGHGSGAALSNNSQIDSISGEYIGNYISMRSGDSQCAGGAIYNRGGIGVYDINTGEYSGGIANAKFEDNYVSVINGFSLGGAIYNNGGITTIEADFINNSANVHVTEEDLRASAVGGAIFNQGEIFSITGDFTGNYVTVSSEYVGEYYGSGGAIFNDGFLLAIVNSNFTNNYVKMSFGKASGGAIATYGDLEIIADNATSKFSGNYVQVGDSEKLYEAIYIDNSSAILTLNAMNNGTIQFDDYINGRTGYNVAITGDATGTVKMYNDIKNADVSVENVKFDTADGKIHNYTVNTLTSNANAKYVIDLDVANKIADTFTTSAESSGIVTIDSINYLNATDLSTPFTVQVLFTQNDSLQLALESVEPVFGELLNGLDITSTIVWDATVYKYTDYAEGLGVSLATTTTTNDSITMSVVTTGTKTVADVLVELNKLETADVRNFNFETANDVYTVTENLGATAAGTLNINGVYDEETSTRSIIQFPVPNPAVVQGFVLGNATTLNLSNVEFRGSYSTVVDVTNENAVINIDNVMFLSNSAHVNRAIICQRTGTSVINASFYNNSAYSNDPVYGGAIFIGRGKSDITGLFKRNSTHSNDSISAGGAIYNSSADVNIVANFEGNYAYSDGYLAYGGAIYNEGTLTIKNSNFTDNYAYSADNRSYYVLGGAIYSKGVLNIIADDYTSLFSGNYIQTKASSTKYYEAIYVSQNSTLTLNAKNNGIIQFNDYINGSTGYDVLVTGDSTGTLKMYNDIKNADLSVENVKFDTADGKVMNYSLNSLTSNANAKYVIDIDVINKTADKFVATNTSTGVVTIDSLNFITGSLADITVDNPIQILKLPLDSDLQLALSESLVQQMSAYNLETEIAEVIYEEVVPTVKWNDAFGKFGITYSAYAQLGLTATDTTNDSIGYYIKEYGDVLGKELLNSYGDTLKLWNKLETEEVRNFSFDASDNVYTVTESIGVTSAGTLNINGVSSTVESINETTGEKVTTTKRSTIDFAGLNGFELSNKTILNISNIEIKNGNRVSRGNYGGAICLYDDSSSMPLGLGGVSKVVLNLDNVAFTANSSANYGGAIYNDYTVITGISGEFNGNYATGVVPSGSYYYRSNAYGGAIYNNAGTIGDITADFTGNYAIFWYLTSSYNDTFSTYGGAIYNNGGTIGNITGDFVGNYVMSYTLNQNNYMYYSGPAHGGAIYNTGKIASITNAKFIDNYASSTGLGTDETYVRGGAIYTAGSLDVVADNGTSLFSGNYVIYNQSGKLNEAIYVDNTNANLILKSINKGTIQFDDYINGLTGYNVLVTGDSTSTVKMFNDIKNADVLVENVNFDTVDNIVKVYKFNTLKSIENAKYTLDVNVENALLDNNEEDVVDKFTTLFYSEGRVVLNDLNVVAGNLSSITNLDTKIQILSTQNDMLQLELSDTLRAELESISGVVDLGLVNEIVYDEITPTVKWDDVFNYYNQSSKAKAKLGLATTNTKNDSIGLEIFERDIQEKTLLGTLNNPLKLINELITSETRNFNFDTSDNVYTVNENIKATAAGKLNINGVYDAETDKRSVIDFNGNTGFLLPYATELNISNVEIRNAYSDNFSSVIHNMISVNQDRAGIVNVDNVVFTGNYYVSSEQESSQGLLYNSENTKFGIIKADFLNNFGTLISNAGTVDLISGKFVGNKDSVSLIMNVRGELSSIDNPFSSLGSAMPENTLKYMMGETVVLPTTSIGSIIGEFKDNISNSSIVTNYGLPDTKAIIANVDAKFEGNTTSSLFNNMSTLGSAQIGDMTLSVKNNSITSVISSFAMLGVNRIGNMNVEISDNKVLLSSNTSTALIPGGGIISNASLISNSTFGDITGSFKNNVVESDFQITGGLIGNVNLLSCHSMIGNISGTFEGNVLSAPEQIMGGLISNSAMSIKGIEEQLGSEELPFEISFESRIGDITGNFMNNVIQGAQIWGGVIANIAMDMNSSEGFNSSLYTIGSLDEDGNLVGGIINSNFVNNYVNASSNAEGSVRGVVIFTSTDLNIIADDGLSLFTGNYATMPGPANDEGIATVGVFDKYNEAVYVASSDATLSLIARNNGTIKFDDYINGATTVNDEGVTEAYNVNITGDSTGVVMMHNNIVNADVSVENVAFDAMDGKAFAYTFNTFTSNSNVKYSIDLDVANAIADTFTTASASTGVVTLDNLSVISDYMIPDEFLSTDGSPSEYNPVIQILFTQDDNLQLALSDELAALYDVNKTEFDEILTGINIASTMAWNKKVYRYENYGERMGISLATTNTVNDSIQVKVVTTGTRTRLDALAELNRLEASDVRNFNFDSFYDVYTVTENLGTTSAGTLNINGVYNENLNIRSVIDFAGKSGFELTNETILNISNIEIKNAYRGTYASALYITNIDVVVSIENVLFSNNYSSSHSDAYGGAIYNLGTVSSITADFYANNCSSLWGSSEKYGGAIYNEGAIGDVTGDFSNNYVDSYTNIGGGFGESVPFLAAYGGAIYNSGSMGNITGNFDENFAYGDDIAEGGAISNSGTIGDITGNFSNNDASSEYSWALGGAIYNSGEIGDITGNFSDNYVYSYGYSESLAEGGAIDNYGTILSITNSSFIGNYAYADSSAYGGAIYTTNNLNIVADNATSLFSGNYVQVGEGEKLYEAVYVASSDATLTLNAKNNGIIQFNDYINGVTGYNLNITGDSTGTVKMYNDIRNAKVSVENVKFDTADGNVHNYIVNTLTSNANAKYTIDLDLTNGVADTFTTTNSSTGVITLNAVNLVSGTLQDMVDNNINVQILFTQSNDLQLAISSELQAILDSYKLVDTVSDKDIVDSSVNWDDDYYHYSDYGYSYTIGLVSISTTNDGLGLIATALGSKTELDTLAELNKLETTEECNFNFATSENVYTVKEDLGKTVAETLNIVGVADGSSRSTIDLAGNSGFELANNTILTVKDTKLTGNETLVSVSNYNAVVNLENAHLEGGISSDVSFDVNITGWGTTTIDGTLENANATLESGTLQFNSNTFANANLEVQAGTVDVNDNTANEYLFKNLKSSSDAKYSIDLDVTNNVADKFVIDSTLNDARVLKYALRSVNQPNIITLDDINIIEGDLANLNAPIQIIKAGDSGAQLALSDELAQEFSTYVFEKEVTKNIIDQVLPNIDWDAIFNKYALVSLDKVQLGITTTETKNDSIGYNVIEEGDVVDIRVLGPVDDTLKLWSKLETTSSRNFNFDTSNDQYIVKDNLGITSSGVLNINGIVDDESISMIDFAGHTGFEINYETTLNIRNTDITNVHDYLVKSTNENSKINLIDTLVSCDSVNAIITKGDVLVKANNTDLVYAPNSMGIYFDNQGNVKPVTLNLVAATDKKLQIVDSIDFAKSGLVVNVNDTDNKGEVVIPSSLQTTATKTLGALNVYGGTLNLTDGIYETIYTTDLNVLDNTNLRIDIDLADVQYDQICVLKDRTNSGVGKFVLYKDDFKNTTEEGSIKIEVLSIHSATTNFLSFENGADVIELYKLGDKTYYAKLGLNGTVLVGYNPDCSDEQLVKVLAGAKNATYKLTKDVSLFNFGGESFVGELNSKKLTIKGNNVAKITTPAEIQAISIKGTETIPVNKQQLVGSKFTFEGFDGAIINQGGKVKLTNVNFVDNETEQNGSGIRNLAGTTTLKGNKKSYVQLTNNFATENGGAIYNAGTLTMSYIQGGKSADLYGTYENIANIGGVLYNTLKATVSRSKFEYNLADSAAGAIYTSGYLKSTSNNFVANEAIIGGAIYIDAIPEKTFAVTITNNNFYDNVATDKGGSIYVAKGKVTISKSNFNITAQSGIQSSAKEGGAVYNAHSEECPNSLTKITSSKFVGQKTENGGAIYNAGTMTLSKNSFGLKDKSNNTYGNYATQGGAVYNVLGGLLTDSKSKYNYNKAEQGGAVYNAGSIIAYDKKNNVNGGLKSSKFTSNEAELGGAIYNESILGVVKSTFTLNNAINGGALYNAESAVATIISSTFVQNTAVYGGAIYNAGTMNLNKSTVGKSNKAYKYANTATYGSAIYNAGDLTLNGTKVYYNATKVVNNIDIGYGAIYNALDSNLSLFASTLTGNKSGLGGALYNLGTTVTDYKTKFTANTATLGGAIYNASAENNLLSVQGGTFSKNTAIKGGAIYNEVDAVAEIKKYDKVTVSKGKEKHKYYATAIKSNTAENGGGVYNAGTLVIDGATFTSNKANVAGGALYLATGTTTTINGSTFSKNTAARGGAIYAGANSTVTIIDTNFTNNTATEAGGAIFADENSVVNIIAENKDVLFKGNKVGKILNAIHLNNATLNLEARNSRKITINDYITGDGVVNSIGNVFVKNEDFIAGQSLNLVNSNFSIANNQVSTLSLRTLTLADGTKSNISLDASLKTGTADKVQAETVEGTGTLNVSTVNVVTNSKTPVEINVGKDSVVSSISTNKAESAEATYKLKSYYDENGLLRVVAYGQRAKSAAIAAPIAAQIGGYLAQINSYDQAFGNLDTEMLKSSEERKAEEMMNKYASACCHSELVSESQNGINLNSKGLWNRAFATFEKVNLNGGPNVSNVGYGNYFGGDMGKKALSNGWSRQMSAYIGYNGSTQDYDRQCIDQNGGTIGLMETWYKGNFFTALTANVGGNNAQAHTDIGRENMSMLMAGVASKTGYNFEFKNGKFIVQPSLLVSYSFIHTFEHNNGLGHRVSSDPIHAIQVAPGVKFVANLKNGWQPYFGINMRWNIMDKSHFSIPDVTIPTMSVDPYVEYGFGVQKRWGDRFTGYGQAMVRNGGRNGVMLSIGFRWAIGK